jgi:hypothetical protein
MIFDSPSDAGFFRFGQVGVTEGGEDALARLTFRVAERFDELDDGRALDDFGAEIHAGENQGSRRKESINKYIIRHYKWTLENAFADYQRVTETYFQ